MHLAGAQERSSIDEIHLDRHLLYRRLVEIVFSVPSEYAHDPRQCHTQKSQPITYISAISGSDNNHPKQPAPVAFAKRKRTRASEAQKINNSAGDARAGRAPAFPPPRGGNVQWTKGDHTIQTIFELVQKLIMPR